MSRGVVGRDAELARLGELLEADEPVLLVGEPGIGKTTVARAAIAASGRRAFEGGGLATLSWMPLLPLERAVGRRLASTTDAPEVAADLVGLIGDGILFVDDLQWADPTTLAVVTRLSGRVGLVLAVRSGDPATESVVAGIGSVERLSLDALAPDASVAIVRQAEPNVEPGAARRMVARAGGNPLLLEELARSRGDDASLASIVRSRLIGLAPGTREAMVTLALAARPLPPQALGPAGAALVRANLVREELDGTLRVRHDLLAQAAVEGTAPEERRRIHARLALLAETPGDAARHHLAAGDREAALRLALAAAGSAQRPGERGAHLEIAAAAAGDDEAVDLRFRAAEAYVEALEPAAALRVVAPLVDEELTPRQAFVLARSYRTADDLPAVRRVLARALGRIAPGHPATIADEVALRVEEARAAVGALGDTTEMLALARTADDLARRHGIRRADARAVLGAARCQANDASGLDDLAVAVDEAFAEHDLATAFWAASTLAFELMKDGRMAEGLDLATRMRDEARGFGLSGRERYMASRTMGFALHLGRYREAIEIGEALEGDGLGDDGEWYMGQVLIDLGRLGEARVRIDRMVERALPGEWSLGYALWAKADLELASGRYAEALAIAERHAREVPDAQARIFTEVTGAWAAFELGRAGTWRHLAGSGRPMGDGGSVELRALTALASGDAAGAATLFHEAAGRWEGRHARGELRCRWAAGEALRKAGDSVAAIGVLLPLEERLLATGAATMLAKVQRSLRLLGEHRVARAEAAPGTRLTLRERQILALVAEGLRDREIAARLGLSRWTILRAVSSASAKLGAATRAEAVAASS